MVFRLARSLARSQRWNLHDFLKSSRKPSLCCQSFSSWNKNEQGLPSSSSSMLLSECKRISENDWEDADEEKDTLQLKLTPRHEQGSSRNTKNWHDVIECYETSFWEKDGSIKNVSMCKQVVMAYLGTQNLKKAVESVHQMALKAKHFPDSSTITSLIHYAGKHGDLVQVNEMYDLAEQYQVECSLPMLTSLMNASLKFHQFEKVLSLFENLKKIWGLQPDARAYTCAVRGLLGQSKLDKAIDLLEQMVYDLDGQQDDCDVIAFNLTMKECIRKNQLQKAIQVFQFMLSKNIRPDLYTFNILMKGYIAEKQIQEALKLKDQMKEHGIVPNQITWNILIHGYSLTCQPLESHEILQSMTKKYNTSPDLYSFNSILHGYCRTNQVENIKKTMDEIMPLYHVKPNITSYNILFHAYLRTQQYDEAQQLYSSRILKHPELIPDLVTFNNLLLLHGATGDYKQSIQVLDTILKRGMKPSSRTFENLILSYVNGRQWESSLRIVKVMNRSGILPQQRTFQTLIQALGRKCQWQSVAKAYNLMIQHDIQPNLDILSHLLTCFIYCKKWDHVDEVFQEFHKFNIQTNEQLYKTLLQACSNSGQPQGAQTIVQRMIQEGRQVDQQVAFLLEKAHQRYLS